MNYLEKENIVADFIYKNNQLIMWRTGNEIWVNMIIEAMDRKGITIDELVEMKSMGLELVGLEYLRDFIDNA